MDKNDLRRITDSIPNSNDTFTDEDIRNAIEVMEMIYLWKKEVGKSADCDKEAA